MSIFRVEKNKGYTVMSNHHLRNHTLSLKAKGLLSQILSLPEDWDYTLQGLARINKESVDAIREAVRELERAGYIKRSRERDEHGCLRGTVYTIYEQPQQETENPTQTDPILEKPALENPMLENPILEKPTLENPMQLNTKRTKKKDKQKTKRLITDSIPFPSGFPEASAQKRAEAKGTFESNRELILENIDYDVLADDPHVDREQLDEIVDLLQETICSTRTHIRVAGNDYPAEAVRAKLLRLNSEHIRFVMDCLKQNTTKIRNIRQYLLAALFHAPSTMNSYYAALVQHDMNVL
ncbi:MAG: helix-turn-helix domain-containing protein [Oscillospiraceae bacterium]|nr:helix-turn-helix domain-containing protein [Oscillospiraceae bacterium]